jgi:response regulator RpfG family c-di-GMP phosphodiesterase
MEVTRPPEKPRILCVDDEPTLLEGVTPHLRRRFDVSTATSGTAGLQLINTAGPFAVVMSDMRMPHMNGAAFLAAVRQAAPNTVRMLLTGHSDVEAAIAAVNQGQIFRFLSKPCPPADLIAAIQAGVDQYRLINAEKELLEQTLHGSLKTLTDILSLTNPLAFGRATRVKTLVSALADRLAVKERWPLEVAAMVFPIGAITLPHETVEKLYHGRALTGAETVMVKRLPGLAEQLLANIPRLDPVREILAHQDAPFEGEGGTRAGAALPLGARLLKLLIDFDALEQSGVAKLAAVETLRGRRGFYDPALVELLGVHLGSESQSDGVEEVGVAGLKAGWTFVEDVRSRAGALLIARGHLVTPGLILRITNFAQSVGVAEPLKVERAKPVVGR